MAKLDMDKVIKEIDKFEPLPERDTPSQLSFRHWKGTLSWQRLQGKSSMTEIAPLKTEKTKTQ